MPVPQMIRTRWAAVGAAVAVSLGAGGVGLIDATAPEGAATFVPITPCRLFDTRPEPFTIGPRTAPLGPNDVHSVAGTGAAGACQLPDDATGLVLNVTAVDASQATFLTLYPTGEDRPNASHLNPSPGTAPAPNAVTVDLSPSGQFSVFNRFGNVHVLADVVGYYTDHHHDDRYYTKSQHDADADALAITLDARAPATSSLSLAGAGFTALDSPMVMTSGTACTRAEPALEESRHAVALPAGTTITGIAGRAYNTSVYAQEFDLTLWAQRPGSSGAEVVHEATFGTGAGPGLSQSRVELPTPEQVDPGEAIFVEFRGATSVSLCAADVEFSRPG